MSALSLSRGPSQLAVNLTFSPAAWALHLTFQWSSDCLKDSALLSVQPLPLGCSPHEPLVPLPYAAENPLKSKLRLILSFLLCPYLGL